MSSFPSLTVTADALVPRGTFAENQAAWLRPDPTAVAELRARCVAKRIGVVAHFYMDAEIQGVLASVGAPHTFVADSLQMADIAVRMAEAGKQIIVVLGVDFMSENVRAVLDHAGHADVRVYRLSADEIGCSLAASAEAPAYRAWLAHQARRPHALHVVYINTSLVTKAQSQQLIPTITCTSSNVVQTLLQASSQIPDVAIAYGPDSYMGANLATLLARLSRMSDDEIRTVHPAHDRTSVAALLSRFEFFAQGTCIVHHLFGDDVVRRVRTEHPDALLTAHLEVPGEMFALAAKAQEEGRGVVGSTSNILDFIRAQVAKAAQRPGPSRLPVVLGTEAGMVTSIVRSVQQTLLEHERADIELEIIFPVASDAITPAPGSELLVIPGVAAGEGCSTAGGCATCPFMKMNTLDALFDLAEAAQTDAETTLAPWRPRAYTEAIDGRTAADLGSVSILHMRHFQRTGVLPEALVTDVRARGGRA